MGIRKNICPVTHSGIPYIPRKNPFFSTSFHFQQAYPVLYPSYLNEIGVIWKEEGGGRGRKDSAIAAMAETRLMQCLPNPYPETVS